MKAFQDGIMLLISIPAALVVVLLAALIWFVATAYLVALEVVGCVWRKKII